MVGRVQSGPADRLREGLRTSDRDAFVRFVRRQTVEQSERVRPELREAARRELEPGGYWSPEVTADRIMEFALRWAGDDPERLKAAQEAVMQGFADAERLLGALPEVSVKTKELVEQRFAELLQ